MAVSELRRAKDLATVLSWLAGNKGDTAVVAGGTDMVPAIDKGILSPTRLIDLDGVEELKVLKVEGDDLILGAALTHNEVAGSALVADLPALFDAVSSIGCNQTRNLGTIGGNIAMAVPSADSVPALLVYDAIVEVQSKERGVHRIALDQFFTGPRQTVLKPDELIVRLILPAFKGRRSAFIKHGRRKALSLAVVNVASSMRLDGGKCRDVRIALGAVAPTPLRARAAEAVLEGEQPTAEKIAAAAQQAAEECRPIDDIRASAAYRRELVKVYVKRTLVTAAG